MMRRPSAIWYMVEPVVVWRPRFQTALILPVIAPASGLRELVSEDLPTPLWPTNTARRLASAARSSEIPSWRLVETRKARMPRLR